MTVGERIKKIREEMNLTQEELAKAINSTKQTIYKYENNIITNIPSDKIETIARILHTTPDYLMGWNTKAFAEDILENLTSLKRELKNTIDEKEIIELNNSIEVLEESYAGITFANAFLSNSNKTTISQSTATLSSDEAEILQLYRAATEKGKNVALGVLISNQENRVIEEDLNRKDAEKVAAEILQARSTQLKSKLAK